MQAAMKKVPPPVFPHPPAAVPRRRWLHAGAALLSGGTLSACGGRLAAAADMAAAVISPPKTGAPKPGDPPPALRFAFIGDLPYSVPEESRLGEVLDAVDQAGVAFVIHAGDIKSGWEKCTDELIRHRMDLLSRHRTPLILTPGDNEWADCGRVAAGNYDPLDRLEFLRSLLPQGGHTLGVNPMPVERQSDVQNEHLFPENVRWRAGPARFMTINTSGPVNATRQGIDAANAARDAANLAWIDANTELARREGSTVLVIATQANLRFESVQGRSPTSVNDGFGNVRARLYGLLDAFPGRILLLHGDTHTFRSDYPLLMSKLDPQLRFQRVECYGSPFVSNWIELGVHADPQHEVNVTAHAVPITPERP